MSAHLLLRYLRTLNPPMVEEVLLRDHVLRRAQDYLSQGRVETIWLDGDALRAHVGGSSSTPYHCVMRLHEGMLEPQCSCPYTRGPCWHVGSVLLALIADEGSLIGQLEQQIRPGATAAKPESAPPQASAEPVAEQPEVPQEVEATAKESEADLRDRLLQWPKADLVEVVSEMAIQDPRLHAHLIAKTPSTTDMDLRLFRQAARAALRFGRPVERHQLPRIADDLQEIVESVGRLISGGHPEHALQLLAEIATMTSLRRQEVDDLDGALGQFIHRVLRSWIRGWSEIAGRDRGKIARQLFALLTEDHGDAVDGLVLDARDALGPAGLDALEGLLRPVVTLRMDQSPLARKDDRGADPDPLLRRARRALREVAELRGDITAFLSYCDPSGHHSEEVIDAVQRLARAGDHDDALAWAERGREFARGSAQRVIDDLRVDLMLRVGRRREAIDSAWQLFRLSPGSTTYQRLIQIVNENERGEWRRRALDHADGSCDSTDFLRVCLAASDIERIAHRFDSSPEFVCAAHASALEPTIHALEADHPVVAASLSGHLASRLLSLGDSRRFGEAREHLSRARRNFADQGPNDRFSELLKQLTQRHRVVGGWFDESWFKDSSGSTSHE